MRAIFLGTPAFAVPTLERLFRSSHQIVGVVTRPDRPRGRGHRVAPEAVGTFARLHGLLVLQPERLNDPAFLEALRALQPDIGVVAAYGRLLPQSVIDLPSRGMLNVHASLLPRWRGAAPVHRAVLAGDPTTGVTIMRVVLRLDAGPLLAKAATPIGPDETSHELETRLATLGADLLAGTIDRLEAGPIPEEPQQEREATYASRLVRRESQVDWARPARAIHNQIRGLQPWPLAAGRLHGRRIAFLRSRIDDDHGLESPGMIASVNADSFTVAAAPGTVRIVELQPEGRRPMSVRDFLNGTRVKVGDRFEPL